jgi:hypothetical protein
VSKLFGVTKVLYTSYTVIVTFESHVDSLQKRAVAEGRDFCKINSRRHLPNPESD